MIPALALAAAVGATGDPTALLSLAGCDPVKLRSALQGPDIGPPIHDGAEVSVVVDREGETWARRHCTVVSSVSASPFNTTALAKVPDGYTHPEDMMIKYRKLADENPSIAQMIDLTESLGTPATHEGRHIYAIKISDNVAADEDEPNVLLLHNIHARELISPELGYDEAERLVTGYSKDATLRRLVDETQIYIVVSMNPDGWNYVWTNNAMWRKNRRNNGGSYGVDCNRNFPFGWSGFSCSGSTIGSSETYRGPSGGSEPEVKTVIALVNDRNPTKILDYHSYSRDVRVNYAQAPPNGNPSLPAAIDAIGVEAAKGIAEKMQYIQVRSGACGTEASNAQNTRGTLAFLVETGRSFQPPAAEMREEVARVWPGTLWFLQLPVPVSGHVTDAATGAGIEATLTLPEYDFKQGEVKKSSPGTGRYSLWLPEGTHKVVAEAPGYAAEAVEVTVTAAGVHKEIKMVHFGDF